jgi:hypothetical protein
VILRLFYHSKWDIEASECREKSAEWKGFFRPRVNLTKPPMETCAIEQLNGRDDILQALKASYDYGEKVWMGLTEHKALEMIPGRGASRSRGGRRSWSRSWTT